LRGVKPSYMVALDVNERQNKIKIFLAIFFLQICNLLERLT